MRAAPIVGNDQRRCVYFFNPRQLQHLGFTSAGWSSDGYDQAVIGTHYYSFLSKLSMREFAALILLASWLAFIPVMIGRLPGLFGHTTRRNFRSTLGILIVAIGVALVWPRATISTPPWALAPRIGATLAILSSAFGLWAILVLGRQWSVQARLRTDHELVTVGPYAWVRHPIYAAFFGLFVATGLVFVPSTARLLAGVLLYLLGTALRVRSEDGLLRERFGRVFDDYARRTPALIPKFWPPRVR